MSSDWLKGTQMKIPEGSGCRIGDRKKLAAGHDDIKTAVGAQICSSENKPQEEACFRATRENVEDNSRFVSALLLLMTCRFSLSN